MTATQMTTAAAPATGLLRTTLLVNAATSGAAGLTSALAPAWVAGLIGAGPVWFWIALGIGLVGYAALLVWTARMAVPDPRMVWFAIVSDEVWVVASAAVLIGLPDLLTPLGEWIVAVMAVGVLDFAILQWLGLRRMNRS